MTNHRVLITAIGGNIGQGILKSLRVSKRNFYIVGIDMEFLSAGFSLTDSYYRTPRTTDPDFTNKLQRIVHKEKIEAIYVCSPSELEFFSINKEKLEQKLGLVIFVNPINVVRIGSDKLKTVEFLRNAKFPYPETVLAVDKEGVDEIIRKYGFPLIMKPRLGFTSKNVFLVDSPEKIIALETLFPDMIVQRYLPDPRSEFTATTISGDDKKVRASIVLHRDLIQGTTYRTELVQDDKITGQVTDIVNALGAVGSCNLQFRLLNGDVLVFEINPRFSGTCGIRYLYGFNDAEMVFELLRLGLEIQQPKLKPAVVLRYWNEILIPDATFRALREGSKFHCGEQTILKKPMRNKSYQSMNHISQ